MARKVFFSFEYRHDVSRTMVVRNSWVFRGIQMAGFVDAASFEAINRQGAQAIKHWIDSQLNGTSVTVVLVGCHTCNSSWVQYEIKRSIQIGNGLLGIDISKIRDLQGNISEPCGEIPRGYRFYHWDYDDGYNNMGAWIEAAARDANR